MRVSLVKTLYFWVLWVICLIGLCNGVCPSTWTQRGTNCYFRVLRLYKWIDAVNYCNEQTASVLAITDEDVMAMVEEYLPSPNWFWTSGVYDQDTSVAFWKDLGKSSQNGVSYGDDFDMNEYHESLITVNPASGPQGVRSINGRNLTTNEKLTPDYFVCSKRHNHKICPPGYDFTTGSVCFSTGQYKHTHDEAKNICVNRFGRLYEPRTSVDLQDIDALLTKSDWQMYDQRVGIVYKDNAWRFESDNQKIPGDLWSDNFPLMQENRTCGMYSATTKKLINVPCNDLNYYLCIYKSKPHCPAGYTTFGRSSECLLIAPREMVFESSSNYCNQWGGQIASIRIDLVKSAVNQFQYHTFGRHEYLWVDVNQRTMNGFPQYADGTKSRGSYLPSASEVCFYHNNNSLHASSCNRKDVRALCMAKQDDCPIGFLRRGTQCFRFSQEKNYYNVVAKYCWKYSSKLAWTRDQNILLNELSHKGFRQRNADYALYWYGGVLNTSTNMWDFKDDEKYQYASNSIELSRLWRDGFPKAGQNCMMLNASGELQTGACGGHYRYICQETEDLDPTWLHDLPIPTPLCFKEDVNDPQFKTSPGIYDPDQVSVTSCETRCGLIGFRYAGVKFGKFCFCSMILSLESVNISSCDLACSDTTQNEKCGSSDGQYISVKRVGPTESEDAPLIDGVTLTADASEVKVGETVTFTTSLSAGKGSFFSMRFGEGSEFSLENGTAFTTDDLPEPIPAERTYIYHHAGTYIATVKYNLNVLFTTPVYQSLEVRVSGSAPSPLKLDCPELLEPLEVFYCHATLFYGSPLNMTVSRGDGSPTELYAVPGPRVQPFGVPPPQNKVTRMIATPILDGSGVPMAAVIMPWTRVQHDSILLAFSAYVSTPGDITFLVLRPSCNGDDVCPTTGRCDSTCPSINSTTYSCEAGSAFCFHGVSCFNPTNSSVGNCRSSPGTLPDAYTTIVEETVTASEGFNYHTLDQAIHMWPHLQRGDILGFIPGSAVIAHHLTTKESDMGFSAAGSYSVNSSQHLGARHYVGATFSIPVTLDFQYNYSTIGNYTFEVTALNDMGTVSNNTKIATQIPILLGPPPVPLIEPLSVAVKEYTKVTIPVVKGSDILVMIDWGDGNITWKYFTNLENAEITEVHQYDTAGIFNAVIKIYNNHTIKDEYPEDEWIFGHTFLCQVPCNDTLWTFSNAGPVLWPDPGSMEFTISALAGEDLPTNASFSLSFDDGTGIGGAETPDGSLMICGGPGTSGTPTCTDGFSYSHMKSFSSSGEYNSSFRCLNEISNFTMCKEAIVYASIEDLFVVPRFLPLIPIGGTKLSDGYGPDKNQLPVERPVSLMMNISQGSGISYVAKLSNGTWLGNSTSDRLDVKFDKPGKYVIEVYALNPLQQTEPFIIEIEVAESVSEVEINDFNQLSDAGTEKPFRIQWESKGSFSCYILDYGDGSPVAAWRTTNDDWSECEIWFHNNSAIYSLGNSMTKMGMLPDSEPDFHEMEHLYADKGHYTMRVFAFNKMSKSSHTLNVTVAPVPCKPPLLYLKNNRTKFYEAREIPRSFILRIESVCKLDCDNSLNTTKFWTGVSIDEKLGHTLGPVDLDGLDSRQKSILNVPPLTLGYGIYKFTYAVVIVDPWLREHEPDIPPFRRERSTYVKVVKTPLAIILNAGVAMSNLGFNKTLILNARNYSFDPDWPNDKNFTYSWYCHRIQPIYEELPSVDGWPVDGTVSVPLKSVSDLQTRIVDEETNITTVIEETDNGGCFGKGPGRILVEDGGIVELNTMQIRKLDVTYRFVAVLTKDDRKGKSIYDAKVVPGSPPGVTIGCQIEKMCRPSSSGKYINPNLRVALIGACSEDCFGDFLYRWSLYTYENMTETEIEDGINYMIGMTKPNMVIKKSMFKDYPEVYEFHVKLTITRLADFQEGEGAMYLILNTPPKGGSCILQPPKGRMLSEDGVTLDSETGLQTKLGRALTEDYYCACKHFYDEQKDEISKYTFYLKHKEYGYIKNVKFGEDNEDRFAFPYGNWSFFVNIADFYGAATDVLINEFSTSLPTHEEYTAWREKDEIWRASGEGDQARLSQLLQASTSIQGFDLEREMVATTTTSPPDYDEYGGLSETTTMDPWLRRELEEKARIEKEKKQIETARRKNQMFEQIQSNNVDTIDDCTQMYSTVASIIGKGSDVDMEGKDSAINAIKGHCMHKVLMNTSINDPTEAESLVSNSMQAISSLVGGTSDNVLDDEVLPSDVVRAGNGDYGDYGSDSYSDEGDDLSGDDLERVKAKKFAVKVQKKKAIKQVSAMLQAVELMQKKLLSIVFPGEPPITLNTEDGLAMSLVMMEGHELCNYTLWQGEGLYVFPCLCPILKEEESAPGNCTSTESGNFTIGIQAIAWPGIVQAYGGNAKTRLDRTTKTLQIRLVKRISPTEVKVIPVDDLDQKDEICITIPRGSRKKSRTRLRDPVIVDPDQYVSFGVNTDDPLCIKTNVTQPWSSINMEIVLARREAQVVVLVRRHYAATLAAFDKAIYLESITNVKNVSQSAFDTEDPLTNQTIIGEYPQFGIFLDDDFVGNETGTYYVCFAEFDNSTTGEEIPFDHEDFNLTTSSAKRIWSTNFTVRVYTSSCLFFKSETLEWTSEGCRVLSANHTHSICSCNHLTSFGSGFFPQPNLIDFNAVFNMNAADNPTIIITMIVSLCIYIMVLIWGRFKDKEDLTKLGATPLPDNDPRDKYLYEIMVFTGGKEEAATKSKVQFIVQGERLDTDVRSFEDSSRRIFARNAIDIFVMSVPENLGSLQFLRVWHDNSGKGNESSWYLRYIIVRDVQTGAKYEFISNQWFAVEHGDSKIDRLIPVAGDQEKKEFKHLFDTTSHKNLYDGHLWFSVFARPARSRFTRVQRITSCMALFYLTMVANAMFYGVIPEQPGAGGLSLGPFSLSSAAIGVGILSNLVTFPPTLIIIQLFRKASPKYKRVSRIQKALEKQKEEKRREAEKKRSLRRDTSSSSLEAAHLIQDKDEAKDGKSKKILDNVKRKKPKSLPWWTLYIAWFVAIAAIAAGGCFTFFYGVSFGEEKTKKWLGSLLISFFSSILLTQPIKVFAMAVIFSALFKKPVDDDDDADFDERDPVLGEDEDWMHELGPGTRETKKIEYKPIDENFLRTAKEERKKEIKMWDVIYDIGAYAFFIWIVLVLSHGNRDPNSFLMREEIANNFVTASLDRNNPSFNLYNVQNKTLFYHWLKTIFVNEIVMQESYNGAFNPVHDNKRLMNDRVSLLLGYATLRQIRIKEKTCKVPKIIREYVTRDCRDKSSLIDEEDQNFDVGWKPLAEGARSKEEYAHRSSLELDGTPFWGNIDVYGGGGYQVKLRGLKSSLVQIFNRLELNNWIDERTRAIFIEFSIFNAQVNLFAACRICMEQGPEGGLHLKLKISPIKLFRYNEGFGLFVMICEGLFIAFIIYYTYREFKELCRDKGQYWKDSWNYLELVIIILGWNAIVFYAIRTALGVYLMKEFKKGSTGYIKLDYAASVDEAFLYIVSFLVFFSTLKFIKLLRFNKRMGMLTSTLKRCAADLAGFMLAFLLSFLSFAQLFYLLHYASHYDYGTFIMSVEATFSTLLGEFDFMGISQSSPILGPVSFFIFAFFSGIVMINLLLTLVIRSFCEIKHDIKKQSNEYEIVQFLLGRVKMAVGLGPNKKNVGPMNSTIEDPDVNDDGKDTTSEFPEKVDQLLTYINAFYFDSKLDLSNKEWVKQVSQQKSATKLRSNDVWRGQGFSGRNRNSASTLRNPTAGTSVEDSLNDV